MRKAQAVTVIQSFWRTHSNKTCAEEKHPHLTTKDIHPIGPEYTHEWTRRPLKLARKTLDKYNRATCARVTLTADGIAHLIAAYHRVHSLPGFLHRFLKVSPSKNRLLAVHAPDAYQLFDEPASPSKTMLMLNPPYIDEDTFTSACAINGASSTLKRLKHNPVGLSLIAWSIHPSTLPDDLQVATGSNQLFHKKLDDIKAVAASPEGRLDAHSDSNRFFRYGPALTPPPRVSSYGKLPRSDSQSTISRLETESGTPYRACIFDFDLDPAASLTYLHWIRATILSQLETVYGVTTDDKIKIYFHMPYLETTTTLHIHIRVNQADHGLEDGKSFGINEIIDALESGRSVAELVLDRGPIYCSEYPMGEGIEGVLVERAPNVKRDWKNLIQALDAPPIIKHYLREMISQNSIRDQLQLLETDNIQAIATHLAESHDARELPRTDVLHSIIACYSTPLTSMKLARSGGGTSAAGATATEAVEASAAGATAMEVVEASTAGATAVEVVETSAAESAGPGLAVSRY